MIRRILPLLAAIVSMVPLTAQAMLSDGLAAPSQGEGSGDPAGLESAWAASRCDWPMFGHDRSRDFASTCASAPTPATVHALHPRWVLKTSDVVTAQPAVDRGTVYAGAWDGSFYAIDQVSGAVRWQTVLGNAAPAPWTDRHHDAYGQVTSSAVLATVQGRRTVFAGGAGSLYALDAATGAYLWRFDVDPGHPTGNGEIESSPVVWQLTPNGHPWVLFGADANQASGFPGEGLWAVDAVTHQAAWHFNPEVDAGKALYGCGNVWTSPALDLQPWNPDPARRAMAFVGMADCPDNSPSGSVASVGPVSLPAPPGQGSPPPRPCPADGGDAHCPPGQSYDYSQRWTRFAEAIVGIDAATGHPVWSYQPHPTPNTNDDDFGSSPQVFTLNPGGRRVVGEGNKDGSYSVVDRDTGALVWKAVEQGNGNVQNGQAVGGFIGNTAVGVGGDGRLRIAGGAAIDTPVTYDPATGAPAPQREPLAGATPMRSFAAVDGAPAWQAAQGPSYGATTVAGGIVYSGALDGLLRAYDAGDGTLLWAYPLGAPISSGAAVAGGDVVIGAGTSDMDLAFKACDPLSGPLAAACRGVPLSAQLNPLSRTGSIWAFSA
ncbi:MAG TPA: PQQ-binding-like beta-propeller repeat protein [Candidatus Dormibacteraeota bacterium]|nr:PQQ-binding-like beta-propeller repeat protein [Candidatus Dormibacteraeota bacterium]